MSMNPDALDDLRRWLAAERAGDPVGAEAAFRRIFRLVPRQDPAAAFADRVVGAVRDLGPARIRPIWDVAWLRPLVGCALPLAGLAAFGLLVASPVPGVPFVVSGWAGAVSRGAVWLSRLLDFGLWVWAVCDQVGEATRAVVATSQVKVALVCNGALALVAICGLRRLMSPREERI